MPCHVAHLAVITGGEPVAEAVLVVAEIDPGDADLLKTEISAPSFDFRR